MGFSDDLQPKAGGGNFRAGLLMQKGKPFVYKIEMTLEDSMRDAYYFVAVPQQNRSKIEAEIKAAKQFNFEDYGKIVASGWGKAPQEVIDQITEEYELMWLED